MSSPSSAPTSEQDQVTSALQDILMAENAAVFGYSVIGVHLGTAEQIERARSSQAAHRVARDRVMAALVARGSVPAPPQPSYQPPERIDSALSAQRWAVALEEQCALAYRYLLVSASGAPAADAPNAGPTTNSSSAAPDGANSELNTLRSQGLQGLTSSAGEAVFWRRFTTPATPTVAFPGT
ncbi:ferritin-like domain-containing protein [Jatrophihabitans sp. DSM 45814]